MIELRELLIRDNKIKEKIKFHLDGKKDTTSRKS